MQVAEHEGAPALLEAQQILQVQRRVLAHGGALQVDGLARGGLAGDAEGVGLEARDVTPRAGKFAWARWVKFN